MIICSGYTNRADHVSRAQLFDEDALTPTLPVAAASAATYVAAMTTTMPTSSHPHKPRLSTGHTSCRPRGFCFRTHCDAGTVAAHDLPLPSCALDTSNSRQLPQNRSDLTEKRGRNPVYERQYCPSSTSTSSSPQLDLAPVREKQSKRRGQESIPFLVSRRAKRKVVEKICYR